MSPLPLGFRVVLPTLFSVSPGLQVEVGDVVPILKHMSPFLFNSSSS